MNKPSIIAVIGMVAVWSGAATLAQQAPAQAPGPAPAAATEPARNLENGKKLCEKYGCSSCHGLLGQGAPTSGPRIAPNPLPLAAFIRYVRAPRLQMPYVYRQGNAGSGTGRRARLPGFCAEAGAGYRPRALIGIQSGCLPRRGSMRRVSRLGCAFALATIFVIAMTGCGNDETPTSPDQTP